LNKNQAAICEIIFLFAMGSIVSATGKSRSESSRNVVGFSQSVYQQHQNCGLNK
jgi:hypothetical protein